MESEISRLTSSKLFSAHLKSVFDVTSFGIFLLFVLGFLHIFVIVHCNALRNKTVISNLFVFLHCCPSTKGIFLLFFIFKKAPVA